MPAAVEGTTDVGVLNALATASGLRGYCTHLIGVGGSGMSGAAVLLSDLGATVSGTDRVAFEGLGSLVERGVRVAIGHDAARLDPNVHLVVASAAIAPTNPEIVRARQLGIPVLKYAELLGMLMRPRKGIAIAGTHGKSTTCGMCVHLLQQAGLSPSFVIGAKSRQLGGSAGLGRGDHLVVESCEFDRSFLQLCPHLAVILNVELDHLDCYADLEQIASAFGEFAERVEGEGVLLCRADDERALAAARRSTARMETFGIAEHADWNACEVVGDGGNYRFGVRYQGRRFLKPLRLSIPGRHNVLNALAAIALAHHAGADRAVLAEAITGFGGMDRRLMLRARAMGMTLVDDYAHHPTEIQVTLQAALERYEPGRVWVVFQPHQRARTRHFMKQFSESFDNVEEVIVTEVFGAREEDSETVSSETRELVDRLCARGVRGRLIAELDRVAPYLTGQLRAGDLVLTLGAGDVWKVADELVQRICGPDHARCSGRETDVVPTRRASEVSVSAA